MKKFLRNFIISTVLLTLSSNFAFALDPNIPKAKIQKQEAKNIEEVKTFDFEQVLQETEKYFTASLRWKKIKCSPKTSFVCTKRECPAITYNDTHFVIDKEDESLSICRNQRCRIFKAEITPAGVFNTVKIKDSNGIIIRILGDSRYKEITILGLDAYISNGECEDYDEEKEKIAEEEKSKIVKYKLKKGKEAKSKP